MCKTAVKQSYFTLATELAAFLCLYILLEHQYFFFYYWVYFKIISQKSKLDKPSH